MRLHVRDIGRGPALLLLHGVTSAAEDLMPLALALSAERRVLVPDLPGYGLSAALEPSFTFPAVERVLEQALSERDIREVAIVGFSSGAHQGLAMARNRSVAVSHVAALGGFVSLPDDKRAEYREVADAVVAGPVGALEDLVIARFLSPSCAAEHPEHAAAVRSWLHMAPPTVLAAGLRALAEAEDLRPTLRELDIPVLARVGELDIATPPAWSHEIAQAIRGAVVEVVPGAGHAFLFDDLEGTVASIRTLLSR